jgi:ankyrin repeat protein
MGDLPSVKNFIAKNSNYIFETEFSGKTPLSYACINKKHEIAKQIIEEGVNSDKLCNNKKTSLFYALKTKNVELIKLLLQRGASPWSTHQNPYASMLKFG